MGLMVLGGCRSAGMMAMHTANVIASLGAYQSHSDLSYGPLDRHQLDVYVPKPTNSRWAFGRAKGGVSSKPRIAGKPSTPRPVVVFFHGGDWSDGYPDKDMYRFVGDALTSRGYIVVIPNYRRYPATRFPGFVQDAAYAVAWTHEHIASWGGDPDALFVMGHSAGAHLASMVTLNEQYLLEAGGDPRWVRGMIGLAGPYSFLPMPEDPLLADLFGPPARYPLSQPVNYVDPHDPPMLLISGGRDDRVPLVVTQRMVQRVRDSGGDVDTVTYDNLGHIMLIASVAMPVRVHHTVVADIAHWIDQQCEASRPSQLVNAMAVRDPRAERSEIGAGEPTP